MKSDHPKVNYGKTGVLIINLGTPDSTAWLDIRKYLKEFLSDRRVIEVNPLIWQVILNLFILTFRPSKTAKAYKEIWMKDKYMSPLKYFTERQAHKLSKKIGNDKLIVDFAMRYGNPSIRSKINELHEKGCENLIILPLYPQYAAATTATVCDEVYRTLMKMRWQPNLKIIPHYESEPLYIDAIKNSIVKKINEIKIMTTFQSRFGPQEWLQPYTDKTFEALPKEGKKNILVLCPGFSSDCVETLEEISIQGKESFIKSGGENFEMIPCLNDNEDHIFLFKHLISKNI
jgi:ferrochelatase